MILGKPTEQCDSPRWADLPIASHVAPGRLRSADEKGGNRLRILRATVLTVGLFALAGCGAGQPQNLQGVDDARAEYQDVLTDLETAFTEVYPDAEVVPERGSSESLGKQDDGSCILFLPRLSLDVDGLLTENREQTLSALEPVLEEHGFSEPKPVEQTGPWRYSSSDDSNGATFRIRASNETELSLTVPVSASDCAG